MFDFIHYYKNFILYLPYFNLPFSSEVISSQKLVLLSCDLKFVWILPDYKPSNIALIALSFASRTCSNLKFALFRISFSLINELMIFSFSFYPIMRFSCCSWHCSLRYLFYFVNLSSWNYIYNLLFWIWDSYYLFCFQP